MKYIPSLSAKKTMSYFIIPSLRVFCNLLFSFHFEYPTGDLYIIYNFSCPIDRNFGKWYTNENRFFTFAGQCPCGFFYMMIDYLILTLVILAVILSIRYLYKRRGAGCGCGGCAGCALRCPKRKGDHHH